MPVIYSPHWNRETGVCERHKIMSTPCHECLGTKDPDIEVRLTRSDYSALGMDPEMEVEDLLPIDHADWLVERIIN